MLTMQPTGTFAVRYRLPQGPHRRVTYEPRSGGGWTRRTEIWTGRSWRTEGEELVEDVAIDGFGTGSKSAVYRGP